MAEPDKRAPTKAEIDEVLAQFGGNARAAIAALLQVVAVLAADDEADVSHGFVRSESPAGEAPDQLQRCGRVISQEAVV